MHGFADHNGSPGVRELDGIRPARQIDFRGATWLRRFAAPSVRVCGSMKETRIVA
ncbi:MULTISPECIES: hypothetical protein [unclassified Parafrankia]|uniref:hypothetical protein n=1 Tax=unclassified Parafrankia TaxID=2994368 RepID=UPI000DA549AE|nr:MULTISPECIES: hypothetical protein [unclassified Parafrankia]SQD99560.1 hypothetical protein FMEAI12_5420006 [Parafrankia sp. Ea1.12]